jgi:hypothetical protein
MDEASAPAGWQAYGQALLSSMSGVLAEVPEDHHPKFLETADFWLALGLAAGLERPSEAKRLLELMEPDQEARAEISRDAEELCKAVFA